MARQLVKGVVIALATIVVLSTLPVAAPRQPTEHVRRVTLSFPAPLVEKALLRGYVTVSIPGAGLYTVPGAPLVPVKPLVIKLPYGSKVRYVRVSARTAKLSGKYRLLPCPQPLKLSPQPRGKARLFREDPRIYRSSKPYPGRVFEYEVKVGIDPLTLERATFVVVRLFPVQYTPTTGAISYVTKATVTVSYVEPPTAPRPTQAVNMIVITSEALLSAATEFARWKNSTGIVAKVYTVEWIDQNFQGEDLPAKIRAFINSTWNEYNITWVVLFGDSEHVPAREAYVYIEYEGGEITYIETDLYYADLQGTWDTDGDGLYGEPEDDVDAYPDVIVGRIPVSDLSEADAVLTKLESYSPLNEWFRRVLFLGTVTFGDPLAPEGEILKDYIEANCLPANFSWVKLCESLGDLTPDNFKEEASKGYGFINFAGHGNVDLWYFGEGGWITNDDIFQLTNGFNASVVATMACLTGDWADTDVCIGEAFLIHSGGGAIAYLGAADVTWSYVGYYVTEGLAGEVDWRFIAAFKELEESGVTPTPGLMYVMAIRGYLDKHGRSDKYDWCVIVEYGSLLGDPSLPLVGTGSPPPPPPTPVLKGYVLDEEGNLIANATVRIYDYYEGTLVNETVAANGYYEFTGLSYGTYTLEFSAEGYMTRTIDMYYPRRVVELNATLYGPPVIAENTVLIVVDDDASYCADEGAWPEEITEVASAMGFNVFVWYESIRGRPSLDVLLHENVTVVVWHTGTYYYTVVDSVDANTLIQFVESGGRLLLEGEDIAYDHGDDEFMRKVAHAVFGVDAASGIGAESVIRHTVTYNITTAGFSEAPPWPDGVVPVEGGVEVMRYINSNYSAVVIYDDVGGAGARVVYIAFPVHYLGNTTRRILLRNALDWLATSFRAFAETDRPSYWPGMNVTITARLYNGTEPLAEASVSAEVVMPNGTSIRLDLEGDGTGNFTAVYKLPADAPEGNYTVVVEANVTGHVPFYAETQFKVAVVTVSFAIKTVGVLVDSAVARINVTVWNNASLIIESVEYCFNGTTYVAQPVDGAYDSWNETVVVVANCTELAEGEYEVVVAARCEMGFKSHNVTYVLVVRDLVARYNLIALTVKPFEPMRASDLARAVGPALAAVWRWDEEKQEFEGYIPGVSPPERDFPIEMGRGYFVYLNQPAKLVEVRV